MATVLLILPAAGYKASDFIAAARTVGCSVVVASDRPQTLADAMGDSFVRVPLDRPEQAAAALLDHAGRVPVDAVVPVDDGGVLVAALLAEALGLPHNPPDAVGATRDKAELRRRLTAGGLRQPPFRTLPPAADAAAVTATVGFPAVMKPTSLSGGRGVIRVDDPSAAQTAAARIRRIDGEAGTSPDRPILVERFVPGSEHAVEAVVRDGALEVLAVFDKPDALDGPYFEETILVTPSRLPKEQHQVLVDETRRAVLALGLRHGPVHAEARIGAGGVTIIEVAARPIGGLCSRALRFTVLGRSHEELLLRHALGLPLASTEPTAPAAGVMMLPIERAGSLVAVHGRAGAEAVPGITGLDVTVAPGSPIRPLPEGDRYLGFLFARGPSPSAVEASLRAGHAELRVEVATGG